MDADPTTRSLRPAAAVGGAGEPRWQVSLLGTVAVSDGVQRIERFPSRAVAALLARLALAPARAHPREELVELLWPGVALDVGRNRLRQVLSTLKSLLEPTGVPGAAVLQADRQSVRVVSGALACDALDFERHLRAGRPAQAQALYRGELMPGHYDDWVQAERQRLAALHERLPPATAAAGSGAGGLGRTNIAGTANITHTTGTVDGAAAAAASAAAASAASATSASLPMAMPLAAGAPAALLASLPTYLTRLFGADQAAARSRAAVLSQRLVTLLGPGGSGKTRLAVEVAQALRHQPVWPAEPAGTAPRFDRIAFVPLVACTRESQCLDAMARALHLPGSAGAGNAAASAGTHTGAQAEGDTNPDAQAGVNDQAVSRLCTALAGQRVLLVLDNFEQLVGVADTAVGALLAQLPDLHVLVTSRRALGLDGETCITAEPLVLPAPAAPASAAGANPAVALFVDRARAVRADFHLSDRNAAAIVSLVRLLHGMPLAIELAASRVRSFPPAEMLALLRPAAATAAAAARAAGESGAPSASSANAPTLQRPSAADAAGPQLTLLARSGPRAGHDPRHASMSQVIDWSWRLLDAPAQQLLQALTLFAADASAVAVAAVVARPVADTAAGLDELVSHSLVRVAPAPAQVGPAAEADAGAPRFDLLEPVREFAAARLPPADAAAGRARLRAWLLAWAQALGTATVPARVAPELATVQAVLASATADGAPQDALALAVALRAYWDTDGLPGSILSALEQALQALPVQAQPMPLAPPQAALVADSHELLAYLRFEAGYVDAARQHAEAALVAAAADPARRAAALVRRAWVEIAGGRSGVDDGAGPARLRSDLAEALALAQQCGHREAQARALHQQAVLATHSQDDWRGAEALLAQSQALWLQLGDRRKAFARQRNRAQCWLHMDREAEARASLERCEEAAREDGDWVGQIDSLLTLSSLRATRHEWALALSLAQRCVVVSWQRWHRHGLAYALWNPPRLLARLHRPEPAVRLMGFAATFWESGFGPLGKADKAYVRRVRGLAAAQIGAARVQALWLEGAAMNVAQAVALTLQR